MTKLKFKIKQGAKKRSHRNKVAKRRQQREKTRVQEKKQKDEEREEQDEFMQMVKEAQQQKDQSRTRTGAARDGRRFCRATSTECRYCRSSLYNRFETVPGTFSERDS